MCISLFVCRPGHTSEAVNVPKTLAHSPVDYEKPDVGKNPESILMEENPSHDAVNKDGLYT